MQYRARPRSAPRRHHPAWACALTLLLLSSCAGRAQSAAEAGRDPWQGRGLECVRPFLGRDSPYSEALSDDVEHPALARVPPEATRTMRAAGLSPLVARALENTRPGQQPLSLEILGIRQDLGLRLISLETQLAAVIFEAECTGELIEAITFELEDRSDQHELRLAVASLVVGALSATTAGVWDLVQGESPGPAVLGLSGGVISAGLGAAAFVKHTQSAHFEHEHNLLAPVVLGHDDDELFPRFVFRLLTLPGPDGSPSSRDRLLKRWASLIDETVGARRRPEAETLLYGRGGSYSQTLLALRERMYDALESELNAQARDLELLDRFLVRALAIEIPSLAIDGGATPASRVTP